MESPCNEETHKTNTPCNHSTEVFGQNNSLAQPFYPPDSPDIDIAGKWIIYIPLGAGNLINNLFWTITKLWLIPNDPRLTEKSEYSFSLHQGERNPITTSITPIDRPGAPSNRYLAPRKAAIALARIANGISARDDWTALNYDIVESGTVIGNIQTIPQLGPSADDK